MKFKIVPILLLMGMQVSSLFLQASSSKSPTILIPQVSANQQLTGMKFSPSSNTKSVFYVQNFNNLQSAVKQLPVNDKITCTISGGSVQFTNYDNTKINASASLAQSSNEQYQVVVDFKNTGQVTYYFKDTFYIAHYPYSSGSVKEIPTAIVTNQGLSSMSFVNNAGNELYINNFRSLNSAIQQLKQNQYIIFIGETGVFATQDGVQIASLYNSKVSDTEWKPSNAGGTYQVLYQSSSGQGQSLLFSQAFCIALNKITNPKVPAKIAPPKKLPVPKLPSNVKIITDSSPSIPRISFSGDNLTLIEFVFTFADTTGTKTKKSAVPLTSSQIQDINVQLMGYPVGLQWNLVTVRSKKGSQKGNPVYAIDIKSEGSFNKISNLPLLEDIQKGGQISYNDYPVVQEAYISYQSNKMTTAKKALDTWIVFNQPM